jgi:hypothetical protein
LGEQIRFIRIWNSRDLFSKHEVSSFLSVRSIPVQSIYTVRVGQNREDFAVQRGTSGD